MCSFAIPIIFDLRDALSKYLIHLIFFDIRCMSVVFFKHLQVKVDIKKKIEKK